MFDEPLGALDRTLREDLLNELRRILHQANIPAIYVTHDQEEAFTLADRLLILHEGRIIREGTPAEVWADPQSLYVAGFLGLGNVMAGRVTSENGEVGTPFGVFTVSCARGLRSGDTVHLLARPLPADEEVESNIIQGIVSDVIFQQDRFKVTLDNGFYLYLQAPAKVGEEIQVPVKVECLV
jgi:ABC-type Fe3+/spermidine/putrescine transport system ATPase subunit